MRHYNFRWWYDYSGGMLTDWGAHHIDIAKWRSIWNTPARCRSTAVRRCCPASPEGYNTPKSPLVECEYANGIKLDIVAEFEGVTFEGDNGRIFVNRGRITGKLIEDQDADPVAKEKIMNDVKALFKGNLAKLGDHMGNFFEGFKHNLPVISDVEGQHRTVSVCHLGNISIRLGAESNGIRTSKKSSVTAEAGAMLKREQRAPYQIPTSANGFALGWPQRPTPAIRLSIPSDCGTS